MGIGHASRDIRLITLPSDTALQAAEKKIALFVQLKAKLHMQEKCGHSYSQMSWN